MELSVQCSNFSTNAGTAGQLRSTQRFLVRMCGPMTPAVTTAYPSTETTRPHERVHFAENDHTELSGVMQPSIRVQTSFRCPNGSRGAPPNGSSTSSRMPISVNESSSIRCSPTTSNTSSATKCSEGLFPILELIQIHERYPTKTGQATAVPVAIIELAMRSMGSSKLVECAPPKWRNAIKIPPTASPNDRYANRMVIAKKSPTLSAVGRKAHVL